MRKIQGDLPLRVQTSGRDRLFINESESHSNVESETTISLTNLSKTLLKNSELIL